MPLYKPSELRDFLTSIGEGPKKGLSQNFLIDGNILRKISTAIPLGPGDTVLEVGPGPGSLTEILLSTGANVIAVELDAKLATALERLQTPDNRLTVYHADILKFPFQEVFKGKSNVKIIANLPYHITTPILTMLLPHHEIFSHFALMVQDEVGRRFTAHAGTKAFGSITLFLQFYADVSYGFKVNRSCFYPAPKVDSAVILFSLKKPPLEHSDGFFKVTRTAFEHRRKMLRGSLRELYPPNVVESTLKALGLNPEARPEELSLEQFLAFYKEIKKSADHSSD